ncbi:MAG: insulinase family protein [Candidatus Latescibacterota bacterium]|nr:MAG: insulinase family protein [Candidatus Latescibacterota bacterium]
MRTVVVAVIMSIVLLGIGFASASAKERVVFLPADDPTVSFRILFNVGSQNDPPGKEGLAALTATLITEGSTQKHSYEEILELLYPMAASIYDQVDKEMTVFIGRTHTDNLDAYYALFKEILLEPAFSEDDFKRVKNDYLNYLQTTLRYSQDEVLGKETLYEFVFAGTPYEHNEEGRVASLNSITLDDVKKFYQDHYTRANLVIGLGGGLDKDFAAKMTKDFESLPAGEPSNVPAPQPEDIHGLHVKIVEKEVQSTAISFGFPIDVTRGSRVFYALAMATSWLGEHRNSFSHLYNVIREARGLNYGDYAYIEHFPRGHRRQFPPPNVARRQQIFQVWIRPVPNETRVFAFRAALREMQKLIENGMTEDDFELTRKFLKGYILHYAPTTMMKLGYAMDDRFYGIEKGHWDTFAKMLDELTRDEVNAALKKHLSFENIKVVFVTTDAAGLKDTLINNEPSPITYQSEKPAEVLEEDKEIEAYPLSVKPENVTVVKVEKMFEG